MTTGLGLLPLESAETRVDGSSLVQENMPQVNLPGPQQYPPFSPSTVTSEPFAGGFSSFGQPLFGHPVSPNGPPIMRQGGAASSESPFRSPLGQPSGFPPGQTSFGHPVSPNGQANLNSGVATYIESPFRQLPLGQSLTLDNPAPGIGNPAFGQPSLPYQPPFGQQSSSQKSTFGQPLVPYQPPFGQISSSQKSTFGQPSLPYQPPFGQISSSQKSTFGQPSVPYQPPFGQISSSQKSTFGQPSVPYQPPFGQISSSQKSTFGQPSVPYQPPFGQISSSQKSAFGQTPLSPKTTFGLKSTNHRPLSEKPRSFRDQSWFTEPIFKPASSPAKSPISPDSHEPSKP